MKILITSLLLFTGLNQALARSLPWLSHSLDVHDGWMDDDYDLFRVPTNQPNDDFYKFMMGDDSSEEPKKLERPAEKSLQGGFFGTLLGSFLNMDEEDTNSNENTLNNSNEKRENDDDEDEDGDGDETQKKLHNFLDEIFGADEEKSSEGIINFEAFENNSSEDVKVLKRENDKSNEGSDEGTPVLEVDIFDLTKSSEEKQNNNELEDESVENSNEATEITDMANSSQEQKSDEVDDLSETDINKLASFFFALDVLSDMGAVVQSPETKDDITRGKEADEILEIFGSFLEQIIKQESLIRPINSNEKTDDNMLKTIIIKNESVEEDDSDETTETTTTPKTDSNESGDDDNKSNSSENDTNFVYVEFKGIDEEGEQRTLNEHKYSVINSQPTSAPYMPEHESTSLSTAGAQNTIDEYVVIRENLDTQQDFLKKHEFDLDKDFYAIISNNFDDNTLDKFEKDIYAAQENLDKIKKNINAMQNLQTKLYFHKLVTTAVKEAQSKSTAL